MPSSFSYILRPLAGAVLALMTLTWAAASVALAGSVTDGTITAGPVTDAPPVPEPGDLMTLVRETVLAVDAGNKSGDYASLYAMGNAKFQAANSTDKLAANFTKLRSAGLDLEPVRTMVPLTSRPPMLDRNGLLRILGYFEFPSKQVVYDLVYTYESAPLRWRLAGISVLPRDLPEQPVLMQPQ